MVLVVVKEIEWDSVSVFFFIQWSLIERCTEWQYCLNCVYAFDWWAVVLEILFNARSKCHPAASCGISLSIFKMSLVLLVVIENEWNSVSVFFFIHWSLIERRTEWQEWLCCVYTFDCWAVILEILFKARSSCHPLTSCDIFLTIFKVSIVEFQIKSGQKILVI